MNKETALRSAQRFVIYDATDIQIDTDRHMLQTHNSPLFASGVNNRIYMYYHTAEYNILNKTI